MIGRLTDLVDTFAPSRGAPPHSVGPFVRWCLSGAWGVITLGAILSAMGGLLETGTAYVLGQIIDAVITRGREAFFSSENLTLLALALGFFLILRPLVFGLNNFTSAVIIAPTVTPMVLARLHQWVLMQSVGFFDDDFAGRISQKMNRTSGAMTNLVIEMINVVAFALATLVGTFLLVSSINPILLLVFAGWLVLYFSVIYLFLPHVRVRAKDRAGARARVTGQIVDAITNIRTVKLFANAQHQDTAAMDAIHHLRDRDLRFGRVISSFRVTLMILAGLLPVLLTGGALFAWQAGSATPGEIVSAGVVSIRIAQMTGWVSYSLMGIYADIGDIEDGMHTLTPDRRLLDIPKAKSLEVSGGAIRFDQVNFAYGTAAAGVRGINLTVAEGEKLAIVGPSGAGKSTLVSLLLRLYDPEQGRVTIDDQDIAHITQISLREAIGMVTQDSSMFNRSVRDNIGYGDPGADEAAIVKAAQDAEAHEFIQGLVDNEGRTGYDAFLGERGVKLSGGQRQRIALARAIVKDAPILVLDEATSALDSEVEAAIQRTLYKMMEGKTVIAIAHRLSTIAQMDRIVVLDQGRIVENGSHTALLAQGGRYAGLWERQSGGFLAEA